MSHYLLDKPTLRNTCYLLLTSFIQFPFFQSLYRASSTTTRALPLKTSSPTMCRLLVRVTCRGTITPPRSQASSARCMLVRHTGLANGSWGHNSDCGCSPTPDFSATVGENSVSAASAATVRLISRVNGDVIGIFVKLSPTVASRIWPR